MPHTLTRHSLSTKTDTPKKDTPELGTRLKDSQLRGHRGWCWSIGRASAALGSRLGVGVPLLEGRANGARLGGVAVATHLASHQLARVAIRDIAACHLGLGVGVRRVE